MKTVIVTGSAGNLGRAVVKKFIKEGYWVIGTVTRKGDKGKNFSEELFEEVVVDVSDENDARNFVEEVIKKYGNIDTAVLTVGGFATGNIAETGTAGIFTQYKLNFETAYNVAQPVFKQMLEQKKGSIFLIGSRPGIDAKSSKGMVSYGLAKSSLFRLAELMNEEGDNHNVITSVIVPGTIDTAINRKSMPDADFNSWVRAEAVAEVIFFYCTDTAAALREPVIKMYNNS